MSCHPRASGARPEDPGLWAVSAVRRTRKRGGKIMAAQESIHPAVDNGVKTGSSSFTGGVLVCACKDRPVKVRVDGQIAHNHACGCTKCWKPDGTVFSIVAVAPADKVTVIENG